MNSRPLVSVITIFLNAERFIEEAIESVLTQTYDKWELFLVDDGSTDDSTAIALRYAGKYPGRIHYLEHDSHQNRGMSTSRNLGIRNAKGEYIAFLDADDVWLSQKLERQVVTLSSQPEAAMVCGPSQWWYSWTGNPKDIKYDSMREIATQYDILFKPPALLALFLQKKTRTPIPSAVLMRRALFEIIGGFEENFRGLYEDQAFFVKAFLKAPVFVTGECWDRYRQHPDSCCSIAIETGQYHPDMPNPAHQTFLHWLEAYLSEQGVDDREIWKLLQKKFWRYHHPNLFRLLNYFSKLVPRKLLTL